MDGWNTSFLLGWPIFRGKLIVSGSVTRECTLKKDAKLICTEGLLLDYPEALEWSDPMVIMVCHR